jgi:lambda family phage minor tail protein L
MTVPTPVITELQKLAPSALIELFELQLFSNLHGAATVYRFHAGTNSLQQDLIWAGNTYNRWPVEATGFEYGGGGQLPRPNIKVANVLSTITAVLLSVNTATPGNDLNGAKVTRIRTLAKFLDAANFPGGTNPTADPTAEMPREIYYVDRKVTENRELVEFELASALDLVGMRLPRRQTIQNVCQWGYRSAECGYTGGPVADVNDKPTSNAALDSCGKRLASCKLRFGTYSELPFGSFPGVGQIA